MNYKPRIKKGEVLLLPLWGANSSEPKFDCECLHLFFNDFAHFKLKHWGNISKKEFREGYQGYTNVPNWMTYVNPSTKKTKKENECWYIIVKKKDLLELRKKSLANVISEKAKLQMAKERISKW